MTLSNAGMQPHAGQVQRQSRRGRGRPATHGLYPLKKAVARLTTRRLDGRSAIAVAVRRWKEDVRRDLGGDLTRAQETILESAAQAWVIVSSLDDWIARQPSLVTRKRTVLPVVVQRMQIAEGLARNLERLGLDRHAREVNVADEIAALHAQRAVGEKQRTAGERPPGGAD